jgi:cyclopropane-fatty-acyl-phospholipid synthase
MPDVPRTGTLAHTLSEPVTRLAGAELPLRIRAWDGSEVGPSDAPVVVVRSRRALRRLVWSPGELGLARAYVTGDLDVDGDLEDGFRRMRRFAREHGARIRLDPRDYLSTLSTAVRLGAIGPPPRPPASEARVEGRLHSRGRDARVIAHHYDLSNDFYALILDENMAYSCAYWTSDSPDATLADAQHDKLELVCRKLALEPGMRLLDVGCGWGALSIHAARFHGVRVTGVTLSREQLDFARARAADLCLTDRIDFRLQDYRDVDDGPYDVATSIEMGEHVGDEQYPEFVATLHRLLRDHGRLLVQQMSRGARTGRTGAPTSPGGGPFIEGYIAPDMHMRPVGETVDLLEAGGFEVRDVHSLREHYARTARAWRTAFESRWDDAVALVGEETARVWRLYLVAGILAFEEGAAGVDQILAVRPDPAGGTAMPSTRGDWRP